MNEHLDIDREREEYEYNNLQQSQDQLEQISKVGVPNVTSIINGIVSDVEVGNINALDAFAIFKKMEALFNEAKKSIDSLAIDEAETFGESTFSHNGQKYEVRNGATRYSFKGIQEWEEKNAELKAIEEKYKQAYKNFKIGLSALDEITGELIDLPTVTQSKSSLIVKNK
jgi:hypothetical protein